MGIYEGVQEIEITGKAGKDGVDGRTPEKGKDYFTDADVQEIVGKIVPLVPKPKDGKDGYTPIKGKDYFDGKDGYTPIKGVDYFDGKDGEKGEKGDNGSPDTAEQIVEKLESLDSHLSYKKLTDTPDLEELFNKAKQASKTVSLKELDDVNTDGATNNQVLKYNSTTQTWLPADDTSGVSGVSWGSITGTLSNQTDLQTALDTKSSKAFAVAMSIALG